MPPGTSPFLPHPPGRAPRVLPLCGALLLAAVVCSQKCASAGTAFRAGAATSNITPPLGSPIVGNFTEPPATHIHDELHARCLALDDGATRVVIVICDNVGIPREVFDAARAIVHAETGLPEGHLLLASTHTHSGPSAHGPSKIIAQTELTAYELFVARRIGDGVRCALNNLEPAQIGWGRGVEPAPLFNRRWFTTDPDLRHNPFGGVDQVRMNPPRAAASLVRPAGSTDPEISFLAVRAADGRPIALLANYSLHYVGGVPLGHISADYFGVFASRIAQLLQADHVSPPFVGILSNGTSGDVNNVNFQGEAEQAAPYERMRLVAHLVANRVAAALGEVEFHNNVSLAAASAELELAARRPTPELLNWAHQTLDKPADAPQWHPHERFYADRVLHVQDAPESISVFLQALRIGDVGMTAIPFEVFTETGLALKEHSPLQPTFNIELANGSYGYLPTPPQHAVGGYETWLGTNFVEMQASEKIKDTLLELLRQIAPPAADR